MTHRFTVVTKTNPNGDDVGADDARILDSGILAFIINDRVELAYAAHEWVRFEYEFEEE